MTGGERSKGREHHGERRGGDLPKGAREVASVLIFVVYKTQKLDMSRPKALIQVELHL